MKGAVAIRRVLKILGQNGWIKIRMKGSHSIYSKDGISIAVKVTKKEIPVSTLSNISRVTGLSFD